MLRRLLGDTRASAMLEFAIVLPVLAVLYIGSYLAIDEVSCSRKVSIATRTLVDLMSRSYSPSVIASSPSSTDATAILTAAGITLTPYSTSHAVENVALVRICDATHAYVIWTQAITYDSSGNAKSTTPVLTAGSLSSSSVIALPANMTTTPSVPTSPDGSDVCQNYSATTAQKTQVGTAGGYLYLAEVDYTYQPLPGFGFPATVPLSTILYMNPRLF
jgi:Flp pilus assembly protein TadG